MADNAPAFDQIRAETGIYTADGISTLWLTQSRGLLDANGSIQASKDRFEPKVLTVAPSASVDNLDTLGASVIHFNGASSVNLTGFLAPSPGKARILICHVSGAGTITAKHATTSAATNQLSLITAADTALATRKSAIFIYLASLWRQVV